MSLQHRDTVLVLLPLIAVFVNCSSGKDENKFTCCSSP